MSRWLGVLLAVTVASLTLCLITERLDRQFDSVESNRTIDELIAMIEQLQSEVRACEINRMRDQTRNHWRLQIEKALRDSMLTIDSIWIDTAHWRGAPKEFKVEQDTTPRSRSASLDASGYRIHGDTLHCQRIGLVRSPSTPLGWCRPPKSGTTKNVSAPWDAPEKGIE